MSLGARSQLTTDWWQTSTRFSRMATSDVHLFVCQHGLWGSTSDVAYLETYLAHNGWATLNARSNSARCTFDGADVCGDRLAAEVETHCAALAASGTRVTRISFAGYSFGGLIARYAVGKLWARGFFRDVTPVNFLTIATPHLGCWESPNSMGQLAYNSILPWTLSRTGRQLMLADRWLEPYGLPLLAVLAHPDCAFHAALAAFQKRVLLADICMDRTVPYTTAAIEAVNPYQPPPAAAAAAAVGVVGGQAEAAGPGGSLLTGRGDAGDDDNDGMGQDGAEVLGETMDGGANGVVGGVAGMSLDRTRSASASLGEVRPLKGMPKQQQVPLGPAPMLALPISAAYPCIVKPHPAPPPPPPGGDGSVRPSRISQLRTSASSSAVAGGRWRLYSSRRGSDCESDGGGRRERSEQSGGGGLRGSGKNSCGGEGSGSASEGLGDGSGGRGYAGRLQRLGSAPMPLAATALGVLQATTAWVFGAGGGGEKAAGWVWGAGEGGTTDGGSSGAEGPASSGTDGEAGGRLRRRSSFWRAAGGYGGSWCGHAPPSPPVPSLNPHAGKVPPPPPPPLPRVPAAAASVTAASATASAFASGNRAPITSGSGASVGRTPRPAVAVASVPVPGSATTTAPQQLNRSASLPAAPAGAPLPQFSKRYRDSYAASAGAAQRGAQLRSSRARGGGGGGGGGEAGFGALSSRARLGIFLALLPLLLSLWLCMVAWLAAIWVHHYAVLLTVRPDRSWQVRVRRRGEPQSPRAFQQQQQQNQQQQQQLLHDDEERQGDLRFLLLDDDLSHAGGPGAAIGTAATGGDRQGTPAVNTATAGTAATAAGAEHGATTPAGMPDRGMEGNDALQAGACEYGAAMGQEAGAREAPRRRGLHRARSSSFSSWHVPGDSDGSEGQGPSEKDQILSADGDVGKDQRGSSASSRSSGSGSGSEGQEGVELAQQGVRSADGEEGGQQDGISFPAHCAPRTSGDAAVCSDGMLCGDCGGVRVQPRADEAQAATAAGLHTGAGVMPVGPPSTSEGANGDDSAAAACALTRRLFARLVSGVAEPLSSSAGCSSSGVRGMQQPLVAAEGDAGRPATPPPLSAHGMTPAGAVAGKPSPPPAAAAAAAAAALSQPSACECAACVSGLATTRWGEWGQEEQQLLHARRREVAAAAAGRAGEGRASQEGVGRSLWEALGGAAALDQGPEAGAGAGAGAGAVELSPVMLLRAMIHHLNALQWQKVDVDTAHYHAHAAIVVRSARHARSHGHVIDYAVRQLRM